MDISYQKGLVNFDYDFEYEIIDVYVIIFCFIEKRYFGHVYVFNFFVTEYFGSMRHLLEAKVPQSLDKSPTPPTPQAESIFNMIISPIQFAVMSKDKEFR